MNVYFHDHYLESHRPQSRREDLVRELEQVGIRTYRYPEAGVRFAAVLCGGTGVNHQQFQISMQVHENRRLRNAPVVHYCWDLYPWNVDPKVRPEPVTAYQFTQAGWWDEYLDDLRHPRTKLILVPNRGTADRVTEYVGKAATVVHPAASFFDPPDGVEVGNDGYVLQSMRDYLLDPDHGVLDRVCSDLNVRLVKTTGAIPDAEYRKLVCRAAVLVSPYREASTGGLMLLEGYRLGKPVLYPESQLNGANELFQGYGLDFNDRADMYETLKCMTGNMYQTDQKKYREASWDSHKLWIESNYSDAAFAARLKTCLEGLR